MSWFNALEKVMEALIVFHDIFEVCIGIFREKRLNPGFPPVRI